MGEFSQFHNLHSLAVTAPMGYMENNCHQLVSGQTEQKRKFLGVIRIVFILDNLSVSGRAFRRH